MCRLLYINSINHFNTEEYLIKFAEICKSSKEFQGHGWGCTYLSNGEWKYYKNITPIWEDNLKQFSKTNRLLIHARSAFQDKDIDVKNNMPFYDDNYIFIFNGELRGVKINSDGRIGAEKIFNYIKRFDSDGMKDAIEKGTKIIHKRSSYVKAMNIIVADKDSTYVYSSFNEEEEYFTMYKMQDEGKLIVCSGKLDDTEKWTPISLNIVEEYKCL